MKRIALVSILITLAVGSAVAQSPSSAQVSRPVQKERRVETRQGNKLYRGDHYTNAETHYRKAISSDSTYAKAHYNLGNALYRQKNFAGAAEQFQAALNDKTLSKKDRSRVHHNLGNAHLQQGLKERQDNPQGGGMEHFRKAVENYQEALKQDPKNENTKYNLSYAKKLLAQAQQQQQNQQNKGGGQNDKKQNQDKNQQNQQQQQDKKDQQKKGNQGDQNQQDPQQQQKQEQPKNDPQKKDAERLLNAVKNNEKKSMKDHQKAQQSKVDGRIEKDW